MGTLFVSELRVKSLVKSSKGAVSPEKVRFGTKLTWAK